MSPRGLRDDESGGFLGKSLILIIVFFVVFGVGLIDGSSILFARLQLGDLADAAATDAAAACRDNHGNTKDAFLAAQTTVTERDAQAVLDPSTFTCNPSTLEVSLTLTKTAGTIFVQHIPPLKHFADLSASATQGPPTL
jgi:uncharacterized membrane protein